ncbi:MAG TPA: endonuclease/exonuclease/phosphatase family protein [Rhodanobacteraceae bacterium]|nr:endonuclease/exonuclease/phosphatase family protein [Rhodanobacteraceae bacterium]
MQAQPANDHAQPAAGDDRRLRVLSCNILAGASVDHYHEYFTRSWTQLLPHRDKLANLDRLAQLIGGFDVVGLQEADAGSLRSGFLNQTEYLAEAADMPFWSHQPNRRVARMAASSNGLISRLEPSAVFDYPLPGRIPGRGALLARFGEGRNALVVVVAHLSLGPQARLRQLRFIADLLSEHPHAVLMGDLNCEAGSMELRDLFKHTSLRPPSSALPTFPSWQPRRAIDHILVSGDIEVVHSWPLPDAFSDHLPLAAELQLPAGLELRPMLRNA